MKTLALLAPLTLAACGGITQGSIADAISTKQALSDREAQVVVAAPCLMTVGAFYRLDADQRRGVEVLCGGPAREAIP